MKSKEINKKMLRKLNNELFLVYRLKKFAKPFNKSVMRMSVVTLAFVIFFILFVRNSSLDTATKAITFSTLSLLVALLYPIYRERIGTKYWYESENYRTNLYLHFLSLIILIKDTQLDEDLKKKLYDELEKIRELRDIENVYEESDFTFYQEYQELKEKYSNK
ncbi:hypothetical protein NiCM35_07610 [Niallia circulans]|uniref:hypothetical protein n=1 Tax=Niallia circulans TaxID=1397 RepID=UPI003D990EC9